MIRRSHISSEDNISLASSCALSRTLSASSSTESWPRRKEKDDAISNTWSSSSKSRFNSITRVRVGIRCRPPFEEEILLARGHFVSIVDINPVVPEDRDHKLNGKSLDRLVLTLISGQQRYFYFDHVFGQTSTQDQVFDSIARPVVENVLRGYNGTIMAYGQTGTGKTYTMGILESVESNNAGIIPRSLSLLFEFTADKRVGVDVAVMLSFLQIYRESVQDLLAPVAERDRSPAVDSLNLPVREDPSRGFYVDGLTEFTVRTYEEAEALLNAGLENRAIASTLMNATSSRSHTVLTVTLIQYISCMDGTKGEGSEEGAGELSSTGPQLRRTLRSKLLMVDLAGSERVRRTVSRGARLSETKSINSSLSALGNVIAALAVPSGSVHVPFRDSKLTKLLQDSLSGGASVALIATVGPAPSNFGETLSTLLFASRCLSVKVKPQQHEEVDYAELCALLQERVARMETDTSMRLQQQAEQYEKVLQILRQQLISARTADRDCRDTGSGVSYVDSLKSALHAPAEHQQPNPLDTSYFTDLLEQTKNLSSTCVSVAHDDGTLTASTSPPSSPSSVDFMRWLSVFAGDPDGGGTNAGEVGSAVLSTSEKVLVALLGYCYEVFCAVAKASEQLVSDDAIRQEKNRSASAASLRKAELGEQRRLKEVAAMGASDAYSSGNGEKFGGHLVPLSTAEAIAKVESIYGNSIDPMDSGDASINFRSVGEKKRMTDFQTVEDFASYLTVLLETVESNVNSAKQLMDRKDRHFTAAKQSLASQLVEQRKREEEVVNWSYILKYLLANTSKLKRQLRAERSQAAQSESEASVLMESPFSQPQLTHSPSTRSLASDCVSLTSRPRSCAAHNKEYECDQPLQIGSPGFVNSIVGDSDGGATVDYTDHVTGGVGIAVRTTAIPLYDHGAHSFSPRHSRATSLTSTISSMSGAGIRRPPTHGAVAGSLRSQRISGLSCVSDTDREIDSMQLLASPPQRGSRTTGRAISTGSGGRLVSPSGRTSFNARSPNSFARAARSRSPSPVSSINALRRTESVRKSDTKTAQRRREEAMSPPISTVTRATDPYRQTDIRRRKDFEVDTFPPDALVGPTSQYPVHSITHAPSELARKVVSRIPQINPARSEEAMVLVDRIAAISPEELRDMNDETRSQILRMRRELGINEELPRPQRPKEQEKEQDHKFISPASVVRSDLQQTHNYHHLQALHEKRLAHAEPRVESRLQRASDAGSVAPQAEVIANQSQDNFLRKYDKSNVQRASPVSDVDDEYSQLDELLGQMPEQY